jgi:ABC-2 type transport system ATP-binding protein
VIDVQNLTKYFDDFCAVDHISLSVQPGEILGLLGPNGAGKTTTLRMLTGYFRPTSGSICVKQFRMPEDTRQIKSLIGYLPESAPLYHNMLVYDYLGYVARIKGLSDTARLQERFRTLAHLCGLSDIMARPIGTLSKGLRQRVGLAHAMLSDPEILILDEPTSGLDPNQIAEIRQIIRQIGKEKTIIFSTHILSEAEATCDRIVIINQGKIVADDTTKNLTSGALQAGVIHLSLMGTDPKTAGTLLSAIDPAMTFLERPAGEGYDVCLSIRPPGGRDIRPDIYRKIKETDWIIMEMKQDSLGLENIFQELTRKEA